MARKRFNFWLDQKKREDWELEQLIDGLKQDRLFSRAIREGLRMWIDSQTTSATPAVVKSGSGGGELEEIKAMLEMIVAQNKSSGGGYTMQSTTGKQLAAPNFALPNFEDDDADLPTLKLRKDTHTDTSRNFMQSLGGIR